MVSPETWCTLLAAALPAQGEAVVAAAAAPVRTAPLFSAISFWIVVTTLLLVGLCVSLHYEALVFLSRRLQKLRLQGRTRVLHVVFALFALHIVEIWLFALGYSILLDHPGYGTLHGATADTLLDYVYFSAVIFTTLGLGDLVPTGSIRFLVGTESLVGFMLISWSAAFTYLQMEHFWRRL